MAPGAVLSFFSFSIMLVVGVAVLDVALLRHHGALRRRWIGLLVLYTLARIACYLLLFRPATALQTANYPAAYEREALAEYLRRPALLLAQFEVIGRAQALVCALITSLALYLLGRRGVSMPRGLAPAAPFWQSVRLFAGLVIVLVLWLANLYPVSTNKQSLFTMPIGALLVAELFVLAANRVWMRAALPLPLAVTLAPSAARALAREWNRKTDLQDTRGLYAFVKTQPGALVLPDILFEPTRRFYVAQDRQPPRVDAWLRAESRPMESPAAVARALSSGSPAIYQHVWERLDAMRGYPLYSEWVARHAIRRGPALIAATYLGPERERIYADAARR